MIVLKYIECYRQVNGQVEKKCNRCLEWFSCTEEHFYKNKVNKIDGLNPYCKNCNIKSARQWTVENKDQYNANHRKFRRTEKGRSQQKKHSIKQRKEGYTKEYQKNNKDKLSLYGKNRKSKNHRITDKEWNSCKKYFNNACAYCGITDIEHKTLYKQQLHKEHVIFNGADDLSNCVPSCRSCNSQKWEFGFNDWYNRNNPIYSQDRYNKIIKWLEGDYKHFIKLKKTS